MLIRVEGCCLFFAQFSLVFRQMEDGHRELFLYLLLLDCLPNNPYAKVAYFGVGYSATLQYEFPWLVLSLRKKHTT